MKKITLSTLFILIFATTTLSQSIDIEVFNTSINSKYAELGIVKLPNNNVLFSSSKKNETDVNFVKDRRKNNRQLYLDLYEGTITNSGDIIQISKFSNEENNRFFESDITFSKDFKTVIFTWNNFYNTQSRKDSAKWQALHIVKANISENYEIQNVESLHFNSEEYNVRSPHFHPNGKQLFFISDMPGGYGETDIYVVAILPDGTFGEPKNLGPNINTSKAEMFPFIGPDGTLYFSSYGHKGKGSLDIFKSEFKNGLYQQAINLPEPINSKYDDFAFVLINNNDIGYFTSSRPDGLGDVDIYGFRPKVEPCIKEITGIVYNKNNKNRLNGVLLTLKNLNNEIVENQVTASNGIYNFKAECNTEYSLTAQFENFVQYEQLLKTDTLTGKLETNIELEPLDCVQTLNLSVTHGISNEILVGVTYTILNNNNVVETGIFDNTKSFNLNCNSNYTFKFDKEFFFSKTIKISTDSTFDKSISQTVNLEPIPCQQTVTLNIVNEQNNEAVTNSTVTLLKDNVKIDQKVTTIGSVTFKLNCDTNYSILAESPQFESNTLDISTNSNFNEVQQKTIILKELPCEQHISFILLDQNTKQRLNNASITIFAENEIVNTTTNILNGELNLVLSCSANYTIKVENYGYETQFIEFSTTSRANAKITEYVSLSALKCNQDFEGLIVSEKTLEPINQITINLIKNGLLQETVITADGTFKFKLDCNSDYTILVKKTNYSPLSYSFSTNNELNFQFKKTLQIAEIPCTQEIVGDVRSALTGKLISNATIEFYVNDVFDGATKSNEKGAFSREVNCNTDYILKVQAADYNKFQYQISTSATFNEQLTVNILLESVSDFTVVNQQKMIQTNPIYFDLDSYEISERAAVELNKVAEILKRNPAIKILVKSHTDSRAPDAYNLDLSDKRAKSAVDYLISQGINANRLEGKGYGETELLNHCSNNVRCTEAEHLINRRTEFVIISE
jgi:outer membrane protein OmpA-like peptidoglycan-associated protein